MPTPPVTEIYGIENLKRAIHLAIALPVQGVATVKNKFQIFDVLSFLGEVKELIAVFKTKDALGLEIKDLHASERDQLVQYVKDEFTLPNNKEAEGVIEDSLAWLNSMMSLFERFKRLKK